MVRCPGCGGWIDEDERDKNINNVCAGCTVFLRRLKYFLDRLNIPKQINMEIKNDIR